MNRSTGAARRAGGRSGESTKRPAGSAKNAVAATKRPTGTAKRTIGRGGEPERRPAGATTRPERTVERAAERTVEVAERAEEAAKRPAAPAKAPQRARRLDIQGLRAVCMIQVLGFHAWRIGSPIGVDAFIMISAYLMTAGFVRRAEGGRTPWFVERWLHTFKRLMPPLVVTVLLTVAASLLILPRNRWIEILVQGAASVTYWQNWRLAAVSADYFADNHAVSSPLQHLWSMSMQGQVFLLWPVLMAVCAAVASRTRIPVRRVVAVAFAVLTAASLVWLLKYAPADGSIYFDTRARIWEFSLGSAIAAAAPWLRPRSVAVRWVLSWIGLGVLLVYCTVDIGTYPGPMAAVPMLSVAAVLLCDTPMSTHGVSRQLSWRPLVALGDRSYAVYLLHWPLFVLYLAATDRESFGYRTGARLILLVLVAAVIMTWGVDRPAQAFPRDGRKLRLQAAMVVVSLVVGGLPLGMTGAAIANQRNKEIAQQIRVGVDPKHPGALALENGQAEVWTADPVPGALSLDNEWASIGSIKCSPEIAAVIDKRNSVCHRLPAVSEDSIRAVAVGDSHLAQNAVASLMLLHENEDWDITTYFKGACAFTTEPQWGDCDERNQVVLDQLEKDTPDVVLIQTTVTSEDSPDEELRPGVEAMVRRLTSMGITVIGMRDNSRSEKSLYECADSVDPETVVGGCTFDKSTVLAETDPAAYLESIPGFHELDINDLLCPGGTCATIIGNVFVYMDDNHVSNTYSRTMAPEVSARIEQYVADDIAAGVAAATEDTADGGAVGAAAPDSAAPDADGEEGDAADDGGDDATDGDDGSDGGDGEGYAEPDYGDEPEYYDDGTEYYVEPDYAEAG